MRLNRRAMRDRVTKSTNEPLPDAIGGTITGGPMQPIALLEILERGAHWSSRGGAVAGAAQVVAGNSGRANNTEWGIALSDGSRICFTSIADAGLVRDDDGPMANGGPPARQADPQDHAGTHGKPRAAANNKARAAGTHPARVLVSV
jgi:hypothetical protein